MTGRVAVLALFSCMAATPAYADTEQDVRAWIAAHHDTASCHIDSHFPEQTIYQMQDFDFDHDGKNEIILIAATCWTGTAGPDVHTVLARGPNGLTEWPLPEPAKSVYEKASLQGNANYDLSLDNGNLIATWHDTSSRAAPLTITYHYNGKAFEISAISY